MLDAPGASPAQGRGSGNSAAAAPTDSGWRDTFKANAPLPLVLLAVALLMPLVESEGFGAYNARIVMLVGFNIILAVSLQLINGFSGQFSLGHAGFMMVGAYLAAYPAREHSKRLGDPGSTLWFYVSLAVVTALAAGLVLGLFLLARQSRKLHGVLPTVLLILLAVWVVADLSQGSQHEAPPARYVWSNGISLVQRSFAWLIEHGGPAAAKVSAVLPEAARAPVTFVVLVAGAGCFAAATGFVVGLPALRLRGDYLAIATLGLAEIIRILIQNSRPLGGALGLTGIPAYTNFAWLYGVVVLTVVVVWRVAYSARGRAIMAVREDEVAAAACGIDTTHHKVLAFVTGAFFGGVAGAMWALHERNITPSYFSIARSIEIVVMVTLGGLGSISGAILAAVVLTLLPEVLRDPPGVWPWGVVVGAVVAAVVTALHRDRWRAVLVGVAAALAGWELVRWVARLTRVDLSQLRMIIYALLLVLMMLLRPQGLLGGRELWPKRRGPKREAVATEERDDAETAAVSR